MTLLNLIVASLLAASSAHAATWTVGSTADTSTNRSSPSNCTLRGALENANNGDDIVFSFSGPDGPRTITLNAELPAVTEGLTINGLSCGGCGGVQAPSTAATSGLNTALGLTITAGGSFPNDKPLLTATNDNATIRGLALVGGPTWGIRINAAGVEVEHCFIGLAADGSTPGGNGAGGILVDNSDETTIGPGVVVSSNGGHGIEVINSDSDDFTLINSIVGADVSAMIDRGNGGRGVSMDADGVEFKDCVIGDTGQGNVIAGNGSHGLYTRGHIHDISVEDNLFGVGANDTPLGNDGHGWLATTDGNQDTHGDWGPFTGNVFGANALAGARLVRAQDLYIFGNAFGTNLAGTVDLGNGGCGLMLIGAGGGGGDPHTEEIYIGNDNPANANIFAHNGEDGLRLKGTTGEVVRWNPIGRNSWYDNEDLGIDLRGSSIGDGPWAPSETSCTNTDTLGNRGMARPVLLTAEVRGGDLTVTGTACNGSQVDVYLADGDPLGFGEPMEWWGADNSAGGGNWSVTSSSRLRRSNSITCRTCR